MVVDLNGRNSLVNIPAVNVPHVKVRRVRLGRRLLASTAIATMAIASLGVGAADAQAPTGDELGPRLELACRRIPNLQLRTDALLAKIGGDVDTRGSLLWLDAKIADAQAKGRTNLVEVLTNRRAVRAQSVVVLQARQANLIELTAICTAKGVAVG
jgi:hypothetical protein